MFLDIEGFEGLYKVNEDGDVLSFKTGSGSKYNSVLKQCSDKDGYMQVVLRKDGRSYTRKVHRLVASAFLEKKDFNTQVNHKNGIKDDNSVYNLEWCTASENMKHSHDSGLNKGNSEFWKNNTHPKSRKIICNETGLVYESIGDASRATGTPRSSISHNIAGRYKVAGGFTWRFLDADDC